MPKLTKTACFAPSFKFLANIFVNIDRNEIKYRNHFVPLIVIHKFYYMRLTAIVNSF